MKLIKYISNAGYCSRRDAEKLIVSDEIKVNDGIITDMSYELKNTDRVYHKNQEIKMDIDGADVYIYHKPTGVICSDDDPVHKNTIFDNLKIKTKYHLVTAGRLDINSEGLIIITNNKGLAHHLETSNLSRVYKVRVFGNLDRLKENELNTISYKGVVYDSFSIYIPKAKQESSNNWIYVTLTGGKNREVRNIMEFFGLEVSRLIRIQYGPFKIGSLKLNDVLYIKYSEDRVKSILESKNIKPTDEDLENDTRDQDFSGKAKEGYNRDNRYKERPQSEGGDRSRYSDRRGSFSETKDRGRGSFAGDRRSFGTDRGRNFGGDRDRSRGSSFGGDRRSFGGDRRGSFSSGGGDRSRNFGGDRDRSRGSSFGGDRSRYGDRRGSFSETKDRGRGSFGADRGRSFGGKRSRSFGGDRDRRDNDRRGSFSSGGDHDRSRGSSFGGDRDRRDSDRRKSFSKTKERSKSFDNKNNDKPSIKFNKKP